MRRQPYRAVSNLAGISLDTRRTPTGAPEMGSVIMVVLPMQTIGSHAGGGGNCESGASTMTRLPRFPSARIRRGLASQRESLAVY